MKNQFTSRDYELISAYLDNQLGSQENAHLEARLIADPELRKELHEISKTRALVRNLPKVKAPRNYFVIDKASAKVKVRSRVFRPSWQNAPAMGIISALATILLVVVIFGDRLLTATSPVAMAPESLVPSEAVSIEQEALRNVESTTAPMEAAPVVMMGAPETISPTLPTDTLKVGPTELATPTTVYLYAYPPPSTTETPSSTLGEQAEITGISCEEFYSGDAYPTYSYLNNCPTPTGTLSLFLQSILITPTSTPSPTFTPTPTTTYTPTPSPTPTSTPLVSPTIAPLDTTSSNIDLAPTVAGVPSDIEPPSQVLDSGIPTPSMSESMDRPDETPDITFMRYILLVIEISLAGIAIIAGVFAIILRIRAGR